MDEPAGNAKGAQRAANRPVRSREAKIQKRFRSGFVTIAGRPNAGKSTLLNALIGERLAITAAQAQTTRTSIQGVLTGPDFQIVFIDTPGIHKSDTLFNRRMMEIVRASLDGRDVVLFMADATKQTGPEDEQAVSALVRSENTILVLNKIDRVADKRRLLPVIEDYRRMFSFREAIPVSARSGEGLPELQRAIIENLPESPPLFPDDYLTDQPLRFIAGEMIRESILRVVREEVPHAVAILIDEWEEKPNLTRIAATIHVERPGQKTILIGKGGNVLKKIGSAARAKIEQLVGHKVFLSLFVKVRPKWREDPEFLNAIDWRAMAGKE
ncbi:MAG TPA: GTPase Era [Bryobacteraceae bacterium]|jgi:GTP-binding protein Era